MTFSLFANIAPDAVKDIVNLVNSGMYAGLFYRTGSSAPFELSKAESVTRRPTNPRLRTTSTRMPLSIARVCWPWRPRGRAVPLRNFSTAPGTPLGDSPLTWNYEYAVFGQLLTGQNIYADIQAVANNTPVTIKDGREKIPPVRRVCCKLRCRATSQAAP